MIALIIILSLLILVLGFLLFARLKIEINTVTSSYYVDMGNVIRISFHWKNKPVLHFRIFFIDFDIDPLDFRSKRKKQKEPKPHRSINERRASFRKIWAVLGSSSVKKFQIGIDTQNVIANAALYPTATVLHRFTPIRLHINYNDDNYVVIHIENRVARMFWAYITH